MVRESIAEERVCLTIVVVIIIGMIAFVNKFAVNNPKPFCGSDGFVYELDHGQEILQLDSNYEPQPCEPNQPIGD